MEETSDKSNGSTRMESELPVGNTSDSAPISTPMDIVPSKEANLESNVNILEECIQPNNNVDESGTQRNVSDNCIISKTPLLETVLVSNVNIPEGCIQPNNNVDESETQSNVSDNCMVSSTPLLETVLQPHSESNSDQTDPTYLKRLSALNQLCQYNSDSESDHENGTETKDVAPILSKDVKEQSVSVIVGNSIADETETGEGQGNKESEIIIDQEEEIQIVKESDEVQNSGNVEIVWENTGEQLEEAAVQTNNEYRRPDPDGASDSYESSEETSSSSTATSSSSEETTDSDSSDECVIVAQKKPDTQKKPPSDVPRTRGEIGIEDLPPIEDLYITVPEEECLTIGHVLSIVESLVVVQSLKGSPALDLDSVLFLDQGRQTLGRIFDVFGPVGEPCYAVRFNSCEHALERGIEKGMAVYYAPRTEHSSFVFLADLMKMKGSDASWEHNNEPPTRYLDYSDDEQEIKARRRNKPPTREEDNEASQPERKRRGGGSGRGGGRGRGRRDQSASRSPDRWSNGSSSRAQTPTWPPSRGSAMSPWASPCPSPTPSPAPASYGPGPQPLLRPATLHVSREPPPFSPSLPGPPGGFYVNQGAGPGLQPPAPINPWANPPPFSGFPGAAPPPGAMQAPHSFMGSSWGPGTGGFPPAGPHFASPPPRIDTSMPPPPPPGW